MAEDKKEEIKIIEINEEYMKDRLYVFRGRKVMLDTDLAEIYGYETKNFKRHLKNSPTGVNIILFSDNVGNNKLHNIEYTDFRKEYPTVKLSMKKTGGIFHDRFIVLDYGTADERVFLCGASSKDAGARITSIVEDYGIAKYNSVIVGLLKNSPLVLPK